MIPTLQLGGMGRRSNSVAASAGHVFWRVHITSSAASGYDFSGIAEVEMRATVGGADQCSGGTAISDSQFDTSTYAQTNAFDNNSATRWTSTDTAFPHWIRYQFASAVSVAQLSLQAPHITGEAPNSPRDFTLQWSDDGSAWTTVLTVTGQPAWAASEIRLFTV